MLPEMKGQHLNWQDGKLYLLDQRLLPHQTAYKTCECYSDVIKAIRDMYVRGAPAIGISAAYGMVLAVGEARQKNLNAEQARAFINQAAEEMNKARPTAVNLSWAIEAARHKLDEVRADDLEQLYLTLEELANSIYAADLTNNRAIGKFGAALVPDRAVILTHCNAGALATGGYGTALGVVRAAVEAGKDITVLVDETRPLLQGARITSYELLQEGIEAVLITDNTAGYLMSFDQVDLIVVGADRIAMNGDTANKIGTYSLAVLANYHHIPFYIAAPLSTFDRQINCGSEIIIEERDPAEVVMLAGQRVAPTGVRALNFAFDVTPAELITAIITEKGIVDSPDRDKINRLFAG